MKFYFYPRSPCGERRSRYPQRTASGDISIHALLAESDHQLFRKLIWKRYFYPRSPCGERQLLPGIAEFLCGISIHALLAESDITSMVSAVQSADFYPRSPCGERLRAASFTVTSSPISIHALLAESDGTGKKAGRRIYYFYPRSPCGERRYRKRVLAQSEQFLSTLSLRRATYGALKHVHDKEISIHALLAESDPLAKVRHCEGYIFLSTLSLRRATLADCTKIYAFGDFYPRSPCGERPLFLRSGPMTHPYFYPRSPCGERRGPRWIECRHPLFLSTLSLRRATAA